jgi:Tat protein translocase TatB subunit
MLSGVGFPELILIFVIGLLILGPERLPRVASQLGRWIGRARRTANQLRFQLEREIALADIDRKTPKNPPDDKNKPDSGSTGSGDEAGDTNESTGAGPGGDTQGMADSADPGSDSVANQGASGSSDVGASGDTGADTGQSEGDTSPKK